MENLINLEDYNPEALKFQEAPAQETPAADADFLEIPTAEPPGEATAAPEKIEQQKAEATEAEKKDLASRNAAMYVSLVDLIVCRGCNLLTGEDSERYKLTKSEKEEYTKVSAEYFYTIDAKVSPALVFMVSTFTIFSAILFRCYGDYKAKVKREKEAAERKKREIAAAEAAAAAIVQTAPQALKIIPLKVEEYKPTEPPARTKEITIYKEEIKEALTSRSNFEIYTEEDKKEGSKTWKDALLGKYKNTPSNDRQTYEECLKAENNTPSEIPARMIQQMREAGESWKTINLKIRKYLKSLPTMLIEG
jgi:hypothetical protein